MGKVGKSLLLLVLPTAYPGLANISHIFIVRSLRSALGPGQRPSANKIMMLVILLIDRLYFLLQQKGMEKLLCVLVLPNCSIESAKSSYFSPQCFISCLPILTFNILLLVATVG